MPELDKHIIIGIISGFIISLFITLIKGDFVGYQILFWILILVIGTIIPDIIEPRGRPKEHRDFFHTRLRYVLFIVIVLMPFALIQVFYLDFLFFFVLGWLIHLFADSRF